MPPKQQKEPSRERPVTRSSSRPSSRPSSGRSAWQGMEEQVWEMFLLIIIAIVVLGALLGFLRGSPLNNLLYNLSPENRNVLEQVKSPIGGSVLLGSGTTVYSLPDGIPIGTQDAGARGTVTGGPMFFNGERYWYVDFENGPDGWVPESVLRNGSGGNFDPGDTPVGSEVQAKNEVSVYGAPGGTAVGLQSKGAKGVVTAGPRFANGERYWLVDFENGPDGWVKEKDLLAANGGPFRPGSTPVGMTAYATKDVSVHDSPGGYQLGTQRAGAKGVITEGPRFFGGKRYWYVDFENGPDGWVAEDGLRVPGQATPLSRIVSSIVGLFKLISTILSLFFLSGIVYSVIRISQVTTSVRKKERAMESQVQTDSLGQEYKNTRWARVIAHVQSESGSDWRLAILEADIMLSELLERMGYAGENVGEKLKTIEQSDFTSIEDAWEAHKVRNLIAHQGSDYILSKREAQRVVGLYANVFREFRYI